MRKWAEDPQTTTPLPSTATHILDHCYDARYTDYRASPWYHLIIHLGKKKVAINKTVQGGRRAGWGAEWTMDYNSGVGVRSEGLTNWRRFCSFFTSTFSLALLGCNWAITFFKFKVYNLLIWYTCILQKDHTVVSANTATPGHSYHRTLVGRTFKIRSRPAFKYIIQYS